MNIPSETQVDKFADSLGYASGFVHTFPEYAEAMVVGTVYTEKAYIIHILSRFFAAVGKEFPEIQPDDAPAPATYTAQPHKEGSA